MLNVLTIAQYVIVWFHHEAAPFKEHNLQLNIKIKLISKLILKSELV